MSDDKILKQVLQGIKDIGVETVKETGQQAEKMTDSVITGKELLGIKPMSEPELAQKKAEDERKKQEEMARLQAQMKEPGRNVESEMKEVRSEEEQQKKQEEEKFLEQIRLQREAEEAERTALAAGGGESTNPAKRKKARGSAFVQGKKKSSAPDPSQMSQTAEFSGKME